MGTDNETREFALYFGDQRIGTFSELENLPVIEPQGEIEQVVKKTPDFTFTAHAWKSCRSRKRFIKLMMGVFELPRNRAAHLADTAMRHGCPSYQDLWADCYTFFIKEVLEYMATHSNADNPARGSE